MKIKNKKLLFFILFLSIIAVIFVLITISKRKNDFSAIPIENTNFNKNNSKINENSIMIDFNGDGTKEVLNVIEKETGMANMDLFDLEGNKIAGLMDELYLYNTTLFKIVKLNENSSKEYLQWDMATGPHQVQTVFLTVIGDLIQPIYSMDFEKKTMYSPFYNSRGSLVVSDANYDGLVEIIENVDEYPVDAPRLEDPEIEKLIREEFSKEGVEFSEDNTKELVENDDAITGGMLEIIKRENNGIGRGRKAIMAIHSFVDAETPFFRRLPENEYEEIAGKLVAISEEIEKLPKDPDNAWEYESFVRYSDLEQDSKDFNEFVRNFWTIGRIYEFPIPDESGE